MSRISLGLALLTLGLGACDLLGNAYSCGYQVGHGVVDETLNAGEKAQADQAAWQAACEPPNPVGADVQLAGNSACADSYTVEETMIVCDDPGLEPGTQPSGCQPFHKGDLLDKATFECPSGATGACLCCRDAPTSCSLGGTFCTEGPQCCSGNCVIDDADGGTRGSCD